MNTNYSSSLRAHVFRLKPEADLKVELMNWAKQNQIRAAVILTVVGSLKKLNLRYANQPSGTPHEGFFEIISVVGTFNRDSAHLHIGVSSNTGQTIGGHLLDGNIVYTTAEIVVAELDGLEFARETDPQDQGGSGYAELKVLRPLSDT